ncbi:hypothetical protein [Luteimonas fraxinea]|uniref:Uncharacterized protein n=1 Tax=Luteimonas fraxinea TaxID=2901869 RepID=A0ABS8UC21_9GAMM|nr:hypothetical protein [Luteimonas fraxinea]MCD9096198.1 hypothetical protein [Luteimonas fraxinea]
MDLSTLVPVERTVDVLHPKTKQPTGLKLTLAHESDPRVIEATRKVFDEAREKGDVDPDRGRKLTMAHVVGWEWTGEATFNGERPTFSPETLAAVCKVPPVAVAIFKAIGDDAGFYEG